MDKVKIAEKISALINPDLENPQISDRTISETLEPLMSMVTEDESIDDFVARIQPIFNTIAGNVRKDVSTIVAKVKEQETKEPKEPKEKVKDEKVKEPKNEANDDTPEWAKSLMDKIKELEQSNTERDRGRASELTQKELIEKAKKLYPSSVIDVASLDFDFSNEEANAKFETRLGVVASKMNVKPSNSKVDTTNDYDAFFKTLDANQDFKNL